MVRSLLSEVLFACDGTPPTCGDIWCASGAVPATREPPADCDEGALPAAVLLLDLESLLPLVSAVTMPKPPPITRVAPARAPRVMPKRRRRGRAAAAARPAPSSAATEAVPNGGSRYRAAST